MRSNTVKPNDLRTEGGAPAKKINAEQALERSIMSCLLWEDNYYEDGQAIADRIKCLVELNDPKTVAKLALKAKKEMHLRHVPLYMLVCLLQHKKFRGKELGDLVYQLIQRPDEIGELVALYWKDGKKPLPAQFKIGLARAFHRFNEYQFGKYNSQNSEIKLRDVMFLVKPKPKDDIEKILFASIANKTLKSPDTWEVQLSAGKDKGETFKRLMSEGKLGGLAFLRNLRNMIGEGIPNNVLATYAVKCKFDKVLPFRFIAAAKYAPQLEDELQNAMFKSVAEMEKLPGKTVLLVDNSGSMDIKLSTRSELSRFDAASGLAMLLREICDEVVIYSFSDNVKLVPNRRGFALRDAIRTAVQVSGTDTTGALAAANRNDNYDRIIILTDEQSTSRYKLANPKTSGYVINVGTDKNGIGYGAWTHVDGWSEAVVRYIQALEASKSRGKLD